MSLDERLDRALRAMAVGQDTPEVYRLIAELGYAAPQEVERWLTMVVRSPPAATAPEAAADVPSPLAPVLRPTVAAAAACRHPDRTLRLGLNLLEGLVERGDSLQRLAADPAAVHRLVALLGASPWLGELLVADPRLVDDFLPDRPEGHPQQQPAVGSRADLAAALDHCDGDEEAELLALRAFKHRGVLNILAADLAGRLDLDGVSGALTDLAELLLGTVLARVGRRLGLGDDPAALPLGIVGYGKLGSREMSYASDTDIVFLYEPGCGVPEAELARFARTVNHWITASTAAGSLYATDFRLRPYGDGGNLVSSFDSFRDYQTHQAWTWEHQALTRARWLAGDARLGAAFPALRAATLQRPRDPGRLRDDILGMRARIQAAHGRGLPAGAFDVKHSRGAIIDLEFAVQYTVLRHAAQHPALLESTVSQVILATAAGRALVHPELAAGAARAYHQYRLWMHAERLQGNEHIRVAEAVADPHRRAVLALWQHALDDRP